MAKRMKAGTPASPVKDDQRRNNTVANSIYVLRRRKGLTLAELAIAVGADKGFLSRLERGQKSPSISMLLRISEALGVQIGELFGEATHAESILLVRRNQYVDIQSDEQSGANLLRVILPASQRRRLSMFLIEPGRQSNSHPANHPGDETLYVIEGKMVVEFPDRSMELEKGDCVHFDGHLRHDIRQIGEEKSQALLIIAQDLNSPNGDI